MKEQASEYDLIIFMGQSNMAGRGVSSCEWEEGSPEIIQGAGYEFRAISDPNKIFSIEEPFGVYENNPQGISEPGSKTGSMVTSFINAYYTESGRPIIAVSASKGGSVIASWQDEDDYLTDAMKRLQKAATWCKNNDIKIKDQFMVWCQGESDADKSTPLNKYHQMFNKMLNVCIMNGIKHCFLIAIGAYNGKENIDYGPMNKLQISIAERTEHVTLVSDSFKTMKEQGKMKDSYHYYQIAYNEVGKEAGYRAARYKIIERATNNRLSDLPNIGAVLEKQLHEVGINTYDELAEIGAQQAWLRIQKIDSSACIHRLQALEGAIYGMKKSALSPEVKEELRIFYRLHKL